MSILVRHQLGAERYRLSKAQPIASSIESRLNKSLRPRMCLTRQGEQWEPAWQRRLRKERFKAAAQSADHGVPSHRDSGSAALSP